MKFKCFDIKDIAIVGQLHMELSSGSWKATNCNLLVVEHKTQNLMGRDILTKQGMTTIQQQTNIGKKILNINENNLDQILQNGFSKNTHTYEKDWVRAKTNCEIRTKNEKKTPRQHKGRRVTLHLVEKVESPLQKLIDDNQIIRREKCHDDLFLSPVVKAATQNNLIKKSNGFKRTKQGNPQKQISNAKYLSLNRFTCNANFNKQKQ